ncbi:MAG TPA: hypothetical protein VI583_15980 [Cyclobacteriaceae bacterium]|nr:hypothetical protein [Cyclobacteriaceae bacterium]
MQGKNIISKGFRVSIIFLFLLSGCRNEYFTTSRYQDITYRPSIAIPVGNAVFSINDLLVKLDSVVQTGEGEDGVVEIIYYDSLSPVYLAEKINFMDQEFSSSLNLGISQPLDLASGEKVESPVFDDNYTFDTQNNESIDSVFLKSSSFRITVTSYISGDIELHLKLLSLLDNDQIPVSLVLRSEFDGILPYTRDTLIDLDGLKFDLTNAGTTANTFSIESYFIVNSGGITVNPGDLVEYQIELNDPIIKSAYGYLGNYTFTIPESDFDLNFFNYEIEGDVELEHPSLDFQLYNNAGLSVRIDFNRLDFISGNTTLPLAGDIITNGYIIEGQALDKQDEYVKSGFIIGPMNSNIVEVIGQLPTSAIISSSLFSNPQLDPDQKNFITDSSHIIPVISASLPLSLRITDLTGRQSFKMNDSDINTSDIENAILKIKIINGLPLGGRLSVSFYNGSGEETVDFFDGYLDILQPAVTDKNGFPVSSYIDSTEIIIEKAQFPEIVNSDIIKSEVILNTTGNNEGKWAKITPDQSLIIEIALLVNLDLEIEFGE